MSASTEKPRAVTIFDVARLAGVSHQTVSRVVNDFPNVRPSTRERVQQAIEQLRYTPSPAARALVTKRTRMIGLITTAGVDYGPSSTALHINEAARRSRYSVLTISMLTPSAQEIRSAIESLVRQNVEGIVLLSNDRSVLQATYQLEIGIPFLTVDPAAQRETGSVSLDQYAGARMAVSHLVALGHQSIAHLGGPEGSPDAEERARGWRDELAAAGLPAAHLSRGDWSPDAGYAFGQGQGRPPWTAVFAANDQMALGLIHALTDRGLTVPGEVSIVGFDDIPEAAHFRPPLTTVRQDFAMLGERIMSALLTAIDPEAASVIEEPRLPVSLVERRSAGEPPAAEPA